MKSFLYNIYTPDGELATQFKATSDEIKKYDILGYELTKVAMDYYELHKDEWKCVADVYASCYWDNAEDYITLVARTPFGQMATLAIPGDNKDYVEWSKNELIRDLATEWWPEYKDHYERFEDFVDACHIVGQQVGESIDKNLTNEK